MACKEAQQHVEVQRPKRLIGVDETYRRINISKSEGERRSREEADFPVKVKCGPRTVAYLESDVDAYIDCLVAKARSLASTSSHRQSGQPGSAARSMSAFWGAA